MVFEPTTTSGNDEVERLYRRLAGRLEQIVRGDVHAPAPLIEDACQVAWGRLIDHSERVRHETALSWLATTAVHEAFRLLRRARREPSLEEASELAGDAAIGPRVPAADVVALERERIAGVSDLPVRQQRLIWLQALGFSYAEMAQHERCSTRAVERHLLRARETLRRVSD